MTGLKRKLLLRNGIIIIATIILAEIVLLISVRHYFYDQVTQVLLNRATVSAEFYNKFLNEYDLDYKADYIMKDSQRQQSYNVQVLDSEGNLLRDEDGFYSIERITTPDVKMAQQGVIKVSPLQSENGEKLLAVTVPLAYRDTLVGFVRYVTSIAQVDSMILQVSLLGLGAGGLVLLFSFVFSLLLARSIIDPVEELTATARKIAAGDYSSRAVRRDNDEIGHLADTLNYMAEEISRSEQMKNEFISSVSHELRTPLTSIKGWSETLISGDLDDKEETRQGLTIVVQETERLSDLVEDLLDFSRYQGGNISLSHRIVNINELLQEVVEQFKPRATQERIRLDFESPMTGLQIKGDHNRLKQVLLNLLVNSLKFTSEGGKIQIKAFAQEGQVFIEVRDDGAGIAPEDLPRVTEKFYKARSNQAGSGLGLAICNEIIKLHQGEMKIDSELNEGTTVTIILPDLIDAS